MSHSITAKLNQAAREHANQSGVTFFVSLGEKNYNFKTKTNEYTNYDAALFAKDAQIEFYRGALIEGAIIEVSGTGIILDASDPNYKPKLVLQDAKLGFIHSPQGQAAQQQPQQQAPQQQPQQQAPAPYQLPTQQQPAQYAPQGQQAPQQQQQQPQQQQNQGYDEDINF